MDVNHIKFCVYFFIPHLIFIAESSAYASVRSKWSCGVFYPFIVFLLYTKNKKNHICTIALLENLEPMIVLFLL
jgi:hypothetical protein